MENEIRQTCEALREGKSILYPTDTLWGIGCDATNSTAVERVYRIKERNDRKSMLILLDSISRLPAYVKMIPDIAYDLIELSDRPLTIVYPEAINLAPNLVAEDGSVGIRVTADPFCQRLIKRFGKPIVSTSANLSGSPSPTGYMDIDPVLLERVDYIVNWKQEERTTGIPSSVIKLDSRGRIEILRK